MSRKQVLPFLLALLSAIASGPLEAGTDAPDGEFTLRHDRTGYVVDRTGRALIIGGRYATDGAGIISYGSDGRAAQTRLFEQRPNAAPRLLDDEIQRAVEWPRAVFWSDLLNGFLISSWTQPPSQIGVVKPRSTLLRADSISPIDERGIELAADLPSLVVVAVLDFNALRFIQPSGSAAWVAPLNSGDDVSGWEALYELREDGWLYVEGAEYDHALHVEKIEGKWQATSIVRIVGDGRSVSGALMWLFGGESDRRKLWHLSRIIHTGPCRRYSRAIRQMIFCDEMYELQGGKLTPIGDGDIELTAFVGDDEQRGLALFRSADGSLLGYDGDTLRPIGNAAR
jgi:hypothetical protein